MGLKIAKTTGYLTALFFLPCIIRSSSTASSYVTKRNSRNALTNTTCLLLNYTVLKHTCEDVIQTRGTNTDEYTCFDETFHVSYPIFNQTQITSIFHSARKEKAHQQTQIGQNYTCYYKISHITMVILELPNAKGDLALTCLAFGLLGVSLALFVLALLRLFTTKTSCDCSCKSILGAFIKKCSNNVKEITNVQSTNKIELNYMNTTHF
ncbi:unnamed protein product [Rotaria magnacalcarata]|uniref:Uncharacterized protein n=1 Tax=Rotaria magnacalcarata TaxID=392030 RepID=A0A819BMA5_9BILA|nr:unnamed protein product [Rotaria magnacalcarata]CAF3804539.1 unnamed protein product [Rotaria magnacalcarata]